MYSNESKKIESIFSSWLRSSNLSMIGFLNYRTVSDFIIKVSENFKYRMLNIGYVHNDIFYSIGEPLLYELNNTDGYMDCSLLLLHMAQLLDSANSKAPLFERRKDYFYNYINSIIKQLPEYELLNIKTN